MALNDQTDKMLDPKKDETFFDKYVAGEKTKGMFNPSARDVVDFGSDFIPGVSETKDIISLGTNIGKGNYVGAGIDATALALGAVPVLGDVARKGFKALFVQDVKNATELLKDTKLIDKWKKDNPNPKPQKRNPDVQKAANELLDGKITGKQYRSVVKENMPIKKIEEVPEVPTFTEIVGSLTSDKSKKGIIGLNKKVEDGTRVASRLDIPAYEKHDTWVVSVHNSKNKKGIEALDGDIIGYGKTAVLKNVEFKSLPASAAKISAKRQDKGTIARIFGDYINAEPEQVASSAKKFLKDPEWTQVGYNPFRQGFFYNKDTGIPVKSAEEVLQVGPLVLAKNVKKFTISEAKKVGPKGGLKIRTSGKTQVVYNEGGTVMKKQMEMFEDGGLKDEGGMTDEVSGNDVPSGSTREEVRDDIPAQLSEGEFVFPADVVRYIGLAKLMQLRQEAKQGLKQMEAMGQMGNSDEATMPDDLPFDETDLDIEDDLEYNTGGVVQAQRGTYLAPTIPTQYRNESIDTTNPMGMQQIQTGLSSGVSGATFGTPYTPNVGRMYGAGATPYAPVTYQDFLGTSASGAPQTETVRYFNEATGQSRMIPHVVNADGSRGPTLYPIPDGFVIQEEAPKEEAKKAETKVSSAKVKPVDAGNDSRDQEEREREEAMYGRGAGRISLGGTIADRTTMVGTGVKSRQLKGSVIGSTTFGIGYENLPGGIVPGTKVFQAIKGGFGNLPEGATGKFTKNGLTLTKSAEVTNAIIKDPRGKEAKLLMSQHNRAREILETIKREQPQLTDKQVRAIVDATSQVNIDKNGIYDTSELDNSTRDALIDTVIEASLGDDGGFSSENFNQLGEGIQESYYDAQENKRDEEEGNRAVSTPTSFTPTTGMFDSDDSNEQQSYDSPSDDGGYDTGGGYSVSDDDFSGFNTGGLAGKKKTPKPKKMKRGGLASR